MKKIALSLACMAIAGMSFTVGAKWKENQTPQPVWDGWAELLGWTEEEQSEFVELIQQSGTTPREFYAWVEDCSKVNEAVLDMMSNDNSMAVAYSIAILGMTEEENLPAIKDFCIQRMAAYYKEDDEGTPELIMEGRNNIKSRIQEKAQVHPELQTLIEDNQSEDGQ